MKSRAGVAPAGKSSGWRRSLLPLGSTGCHLSIRSPSPCRTCPHRWAEHYPRSARLVTSAVTGAAGYLQPVAPSNPCYFASGAFSR
jgi:hypothetical protein